MRYRSAMFRSIDYVAEVAIFMFISYEIKWNYVFSA